MKKLLITNVVYGPLYSQFFLNYHLKSLLDESNIPLHKGRTEYVIFTDEESVGTIQAHPNYLKMKDLIPTKCAVFDWPRNLSTPQDKHNARYAMLINIFQLSLEAAISNGHYLSPIVADLVFGKDYLTKVFGRLDSGFESVFCMPLRAATEAMIPIMNRYEGAMPGSELLEAGYNCLHPLWVSCHWESPQFTRLPFSLLWNEGTGLLCHSFSITPIAFLPNENMRHAQRVLDIEIPSMCTKPFWARDAIDCPVIDVGFLKSYYPPFSQEKASTEKVKEWGKKNLHLSQFGYITEPFFYPSEKLANISVRTRTVAHNVVEELLR